MYIKFAIPKIRTMIFPGIFRKKKDEVHYIGGAEVLPPPLAGEDEAVCIEMLTSDESGQLARKQLIEHNLRLVVYIAKKFDNTGGNRCGRSDFDWYDRSDQSNQHI